MCLKKFYWGGYTCARVALFFTQISTNVLPLLPYVTSMLNARMLLGLIAADAKLGFLETAKLAKVCEGLCGRKLDPYFGKFYLAVNYLFSL